jgi:hypothetical protein
MPDNAIFFKLAYSAIAALFIAYAISLRLRRNALVCGRAARDAPVEGPAGRQTAA